MAEYDITINNGEITLTAEAIELFDQVRTIDATIKALKERKDAIEKPLKAAMQKNGVEKFSCSYMTATTVKDTTTETVNVERMKKDGIYDKYVMYVPKSGYVRINYKKEKDNG